jgi:hypothetical protein
MAEEKFFKEVSSYRTADSMAHWKEMSDGMG